MAVVTMVDGREIDGLIDDATDLNRLWIRRGDDHVLLATSYHWDEVARIEINGKHWSTDSVIGLSGQISQPWPRFALFEEREKLPQRLLQKELPQRATSTGFSAHLANWDRDVEPDGYVVELAVFDQHGRPMAVRGTVQARLIGERTESYLVPGEPMELERWSEHLKVSQFANGSTFLRLPFRQTRPEQDPSIAPGAILEIRVGVFGHDRLTASNPVPTRYFNPIRDRFQQRTGSRFGPGERYERWSHE